MTLSETPRSQSLTSTVKYEKLMSHDEVDFEFVGLNPDEQRMVDDLDEAVLRK